MGGALVLGYEGTSPNQIVNRTALKNTNEDDAEQAVSYTHLSGAV